MDRATVAIYEARAAEWVARREPRDRDRARSFAAWARAPGTPTGPLADLGCGPGWYAGELGPGAIALDAAAAMVALVPSHAPTASAVRGDLGALPFRARSLAGAWANASYVHLPATEVPLALADLHRGLAVDARIELLVFGGDQEHGPVEGDDFPGRAFSRWPRARLVDVVVGAGFVDVDVAEQASDDGGSRLVVRARRARTLPDVVGPGMRLLVCGLNPSLYAADAGVGYARPGNRFWPAARAAGLVTRDRDPWHALRHHGVGMTDLVKRATVGAAELAAEEYRAGVGRVERLCAWLQPGAVCIVGLTGWRAAVDRGATAGPQPRRLGRVPVYLMPSTSGLNAHSRPADVVEHLREAMRLAAMPAGDGT